MVFGLDGGDSVKPLGLSSALSFEYVDLFLRYSQIEALFILEGSSAAECKMVS